jgi:hypothetical protein
MKPDQRILLARPNCSEIHQREQNPKGVTIGIRVLWLRAISVFFLIYSHGIVLGLLGTELIVKRVNDEHASVWTRKLPETEFQPSSMHRAGWLVNLVKTRLYGRFTKVRLKG